MKPPLILRLELAAAVLLGRVEQIRLMYDPAGSKYTFTVRRKSLKRWLRRRDRRNAKRRRS